MSDRTAVETIQAAIDKLTAQRGESADWWAFEGDPTAIYRKDEADWEVHVLDTVEESDRDLIVTLHRMIGPVLVILERDVGWHAQFVKEHREDVWVDAVQRAGDLALARAILGES